jgi:hypothetical protein
VQEQVLAELSDLALSASSNINSQRSSSTRRSLSILLIEGH